MPNTTTIVWNHEGKGIEEIINIDLVAAEKSAKDKLIPLVPESGDTTGIELVLTLEERAAFAVIASTSPIVAIMLDAVLGKDLKRKSETAEALISWDALSDMRLAMLANKAQEADMGDPMAMLRQMLSDM